MAKYVNEIAYNIKTTLDSSGIAQLQGQLRQVENQLTKLGSQKILGSNVDQAVKDVQNLRKALDMSFNSKLGMLDMSKFTKNMKESGLSLDRLQASMMSIGAVGEKAFNNTIQTISRLDTGIKSVSKTADKMFNTFGNTVRWGVVASGFQSVLNSAHQAVSYVKELDESLTNIMMVTDNNRESMNEYAKVANKAAKELGSTTTAMTNATLVFAQQGFDLQKSQTLAEYSTILANVSQQDTATTSDQITAYMNAYGMDDDMKALRFALDQWAEVANVSAADVQELATASQKAASTASTMGVSMDQLAAQIATIESVTREAPENIGNGLKTIYARLSDVKMGETLEDGVNLGTITGVLEDIGVQVLDNQGEMRDVGDIMESLMGVWENLNQSQKASVGTTLAGKYQLSRFEALMNRSDLYDEYLSAAQNADGTMDEMNEIYVNSLEGRLNKLRASVEGIFSNLFDTDDAYGLVDALTKIVELMDQFTQAIGSGQTLLMGLGATASKVFSNQIGRSINNFVSNREKNKLSNQNRVEAESFLYNLGSESLAGTRGKALVDDAARGMSHADRMSEEDYGRFNSMMETRVKLENAYIEKEKAAKDAITATNQALRERTGLPLDLFGMMTDSQTGKTNINLSTYEAAMEDYADEIKRAMLNMDSKESKADVQDKFAEIGLRARDAQYNLGSVRDKLRQAQDSGQKIRYQDLMADTQGKNIRNGSDSVFGKLLKSMSPEAIFKKGSFGEIQNTNKELQELYNHLNNIRKIAGKNNYIIDAGNIGEVNNELVQMDKIVQRISVLFTSKNPEALSKVLGIEDITSLVNDLQATEEKLDSIKASQNGFFDGLDRQANIANVTSMIGSIGQLSFAWQEFQNLGSIWSNDDLEIGEKWLQTIMNLGMTLPMVTSSVRDLGSGFKSLVLLIAQYGAKIALANTATAAETAATTANTTAHIANNGAVQSGNVGLLGRFKNLMSSSVATTANTAATTANTAATAAGTTATVAFGTALKAAFPPLLAISAIIGIVAGGIYALVKAYNSDADAAKLASENAAQLSEATTSVKNSYDNLQNSFSTYQDAKQSLGDLKQGTEEWNDALKETNDSVISLLDSYPELAKYVTRDKNGVLQISQSDFDEFAEEQEEIIARNEAISGVASSAADSAQQKASETSLRRTIDWIETAGGTSYSANLSESQLDQLYKMIEEQGEQSIFDEQAVADTFKVSVTDPMVKAITDSAGKIVDSYNKRVAVEGANAIRNQEGALQILKQQAGFDLEGEEANAVANYIASVALPDSQAYQDELKEVQNMDDKEAAQEAIEAMGMTYISQNGEEVKYSDAEGEEHTMNLEAAEEFLAASNLMNEAAAQWQTIANQLNGVANSSLGKMIGGDQAQSLGASWEAGGTLDLSSLSTREITELDAKLDQGNLSLEDYFGETVNTEEGLDQANQWAQQKGFEDAQSYVDSFSNGLREGIARENAFKDAFNSGELMSYGDEDLGEDLQADFDKQQDDLLDDIDKVYELNAAYGADNIDTEHYSEGLEKLGSVYGDLEDEVDDLAKAQKKYTKIEEEGNETTEDGEKALLDLRDAQAEVADGILTEQWDDARDALADYADVLKKGDKDSKEYQNATQDIADSLTDLTGVNVSADWVSEYSQEVQDWLNGVEGAGAKLDALLNLDNISADFNSKITSMGGSVEKLKAAIQNGDISFNVNGYADFSQVSSALGIMQGDVNSNIEQLDLLAAYLNAMGGASLVLEKDGKTKEIPAPPAAPSLTGGSIGDAAASIASWATSMAEWKYEVSSALEDNWNFKGIDLPDSERTIPTNNPSGGGGGGGKGKGSGGSGGGGGSGSKYTPKKKDPIEEEIDRYERVNTMIEAIANDLDLVNSEQDRLSGFDRLDNMEKQIGLTQRQIELEKEKLKIQKDEQDELQKELSSEYGIKFDDEDFIQNYPSVLKKLEKNVNDLIKQYNKTTSEKGQEKLEEKIEKAQERLDDFKDAYQRYDELVSSDMKDTISTIEDLEDSIEDLHIEAFQTALDATDSIKDIQEQLHEFEGIFSGLSSDDPFREMAVSAENLAGYFDNVTDSANDLYDTLISRAEEELEVVKGAAAKNSIKEYIASLKEAQAALGQGTLEENGTGFLDMAFSGLSTMMEQIKQFEETGKSDIFGENSGDMYEMAEDVLDQSISMLQDFEDELDNLRDAILDAIDEVADKMEERQDAFTNITDELEHQKNIIELLRGEEAYAEINTVLDAQSQNQQSQIKDLQTQLEYWQDLIGSMEEGSEEWKAINENIVDTQKNLNDLIEESLETIAEKYENTVNDLTNSWGVNALGDDLDWIAEEWELINRNADQYLDSTNAAYEIQKLQGQYLDLLDGSNDLHVQQMITDQMQQQLGYLRDKEKISEYDVQYAQAQLEILQRRIALEEAQANKSQMKLRRDSQGNYSYVYTADEGDVSSAQSDLLDAQNNAYNLSKDQMSQVQDDSLSALQDAQGQINDIWNNANLSLEEKTERTETIINSLREYLEGTSEQLSTAEQNIINDFIGMVDLMNQENSERLQDVYDQIIAGNYDAFDQIDTRWSTSITQWLQNLESFNNSTNEMFGNLVSNANDYQDQIDDIGGLVGQDFNDMSDTIQNCVDKTNDLNAATSDFYNLLNDNAGTIKQYEKELQDYQEQISSLSNEMKLYKKQVEDLSNALTAERQENADLREDLAIAQNGGGSGSGSGGSGSGGGSGKGKDSRAGDKVGYTGRYYYDSYGKDPAGSLYSGKKNAVVISDFSGKPYGTDNKAQKTGSYKVHLETTGGGHLGWVKPSQLFDTGGYTGSWSDGDKDAKNGKLAYLHQKELVLNETDTKNILAAVDMVRKFTTQLKNGVFSEAVSALTGTSSIQTTQQEETVQQEVHITAEFPNANNASEIEEALLSLNQRALQYSFNDKKATYRSY